MNNNYLVYDHRLKKEILALFGKELDSEGYIIQQDTKERVLAKNDAMPIKLAEFAGLEKGSEIFIKSDIVSLIEYFEDKKRKRV